MLFPKSDLLIQYYHGHNICEHVKNDTLEKFKVTTLSKICAFVDNSFKDRDLKAILLKKLSDIVTNAHFSKKFRKAISNSVLYSIS